MKDNFQMRYRKIKRTAATCNSLKNIMLRHHYAKFLTNILLEGKRVLNIDESWIGATDFRRQKWSRKSEPDSIS